VPPYLHTNSVWSGSSLISNWPRKRSSKNNILPVAQTLEGFVSSEEDAFYIFAFKRNIPNVKFIIGH
jgi:hypothetical protein